MPRLEGRQNGATPLLREYCQAVFRELPKALAGEEEPLHQMRVGARRLRVALPLVARKPGGNKVKRALRLLRDLIREAGASRDLDVSTTLLEEHLKAQSPLSAPFRTLLKRLRFARNRSRTRMAEALLDLDISGLRSRLRVVVARTGESPFTVLQRLRREREVRGEILLQGLEAPEDRYDADALHQLRIRARRLRYAMEVADTLKGIHSETPGLLKELQGQLGRIHDDHILAQWLAAQAAQAGERGDAELEMAASREEAFFLESCRKRHREFLASTPAGKIRAALGLRPSASPFLQPLIGAPWADR
jgi:CHAD domain-containing protein